MEINSRTEALGLRSRIPKVGSGPRGAGQLYYTSRVLNSTARYEEFVKKLRASEKELKRLEKEALKKAEDKYKITFFSRCQRKLKDLYAIEEKENVRKLIQQVYDGKAAAWQDTEDRLAHLLAKRKKEHEDKYSSTEFSLSKCIHALPLIRKQQTQETVEAWAHQVQEKQARKMADKEVENMWQAVLMKETEMLTARMELEAIDRYSRDLKAKEDTDRHDEIRRIEQAKQQEILKRETLSMLAKFAENCDQEKEEKRQHEEIRQRRVEDIKEMIKERKETVSRHQIKDKVVRDTWASLTNQGLGDEYKQKQRRKQQEREIAECNLKLSEQKHRFAKQKDDNIPLILEEYERREDAAYVKRNQMSELSRKVELETRAAIAEQIKEKERVRLNQHDVALEYTRQVSDQLEKLVKHKELTDEQAKKLFYKDLLGQIEYHQRMKERARQDAEEQLRKCQIAAKEYQEQIMLCRSKGGNGHPFMKQAQTSPKYADPALKTKQTCRSGPSRIISNIF
ncbi:unnamed protein product [Arctia plantaginis]|uniref:Trichohyalin-plectin-homology domain-containing protein n=1 Tax=Arctia plantaginis TaxID=874455 RepID=A0A8S0ZSX4_ARCPL|nr:unnamed protein product [Arctia plantaginis]